MKINLLTSAESRLAELNISQSNLFNKRFGTKLGPQQSGWGMGEFILFRTRQFYHPSTEKLKNTKQLFEHLNCSDISLQRNLELLKFCTSQGYATISSSLDQLIPSAKISVQDH